MSLLLIVLLIVLGMDEDAADTTEGGGINELSVKKQSN